LYLTTKSFNFIGLKKVASIGAHLPQVSTHASLKRSTKAYASLLLNHMWPRRNIKITTFLKRLGDEDAHIRFTEVIRALLLHTQVTAGMGP
jgi:hypothetical protein